MDNQSNIPSQDEIRAAMIENAALAAGLPMGTAIARRICANAHLETMAWHGWTRLCARLAVKGTPSKIGAAGAYTLNVNDPHDKRVISNLLNRR